MSTVWLPYADVDEHLGELPASLHLEVYDGVADPPAGMDDVAFYVLPYDLGTEAMELAASMPRLRVVQTLTAGVDSILPLVPDGVTLCNARGVHDASTAELAVTLTLASLRRIPEAVRAHERSAWEHDHAESLADKTVLLVGYGAVGAAVERRLVGFECDVLRVARRPRDGVESLEALPDLLPRAHVVVLTVPMTEETRGLVDAAFLRRMPDGALLVNVARGPVVDTPALLGELATGRLHAALDVTDPEPPPADHPLWRSANLLLTPHVGGNTSAFLPRAMRLVGDQLRRFAAGEPLGNVITGDY